MNRRYNNDNRRKGAYYNWKIKNQKYYNFTDLGDYVIDCDRHYNFDFKKALQYANRRFDIDKYFACSALGTKTKSGDVLIGRNLDLTVSQFPCYITHVKYGKYDTLNFTYDEVSADAVRYDDLLKMGAIDDELYNALPLVATDSMNSMGLYIEYNMREFEKQFACFGTNPNAKIRLCSVCIPFMVTSFCATVDEAIRFLKEKLDIYTLLDESIASGWNLCLMIGDAKGNYGLIEIANDEIKYMPRQQGQGNYYIYPEFNSTSRDQSGYGRLQFGMERIDKIETQSQMANLMEEIMWRNEILHIPFAYRDKEGHIHFCKDREGKMPGLDWRSDNVKKIPVNENGKYVDIDDQTAEAILVRGYKACYDAYLAGDKSEKATEGFEKYSEYLGRSDLVWAQTNDNFEDLQRGLMKYYEENGTFEKLRQYYSGNEKPLRDHGNIMTTALSFSVNCTKKRLRVRFWEKPNTVMVYQW